MNNNPNKKSIKETILTKIKNGEIRRLPKIIVLILSIIFGLVLIGVFWDLYGNTNKNSNFTLQSDIGLDGGLMSAEYTCDGSGISPELSWSNVPMGTKEFTLIMSTLPGDGTTKWSWVMYGIPANIKELKKNTSGIGTFGVGSHGSTTKYQPPCSQGPGTKIYTITLYALSESPQLPTDASQVTGEVLTKAISTITLGQAKIDLSNVRKDGIQNNNESTSTVSQKTTIKSLVGDTFSFGIQGDSHPERVGKMFNSNLYKTTLQNAVKSNLSFYFLLGDDFSIEKLIENNSYTQQTVDEVYLNQKKYLDVLSISKYLVNGNHEQEAKYLLDGTNNNPAILAQNSRAKFFDSPGAENGYYSFEYGNALFVVIDYYWHSDTAVDNIAGAKSTDKNQNDLWNNTLGDTQYQWFKKTLENSKAKYKFVFTHHVLGTGRGGIEQAKLYEWGGYNKNGTWEFDKKRPGWELPIHQLMVKNNVTIFFQGHDHLFAKQELDGVIYQEVPNPADDTYTAFNRDAYKTGDVLPNSGFLDVTVSSDQVKVDYIKSGQSDNGQSIFSYTIK